MGSGDDALRAAPSAQRLQASPQRIAAINSRESGIYSGGNQRFDSTAIAIRVGGIFSLTL
jgi:hypothetical protein